MRKSMLAMVSVFVFILCHLLSINAVNAAMPEPVGRQSFSYAATDSPLFNDVPSSAKPIGIGSVATGGDMLSLRIGLNQLSGYGDVYFAVFAPGITPEILILTPSIRFRAFSDVGLQPWKQNVMGPINESLFGDIPLSLLPPATYQFYLAVTPTGSFENYFLWITSFTVPGVADYSGAFYVTLSVQPRWIMEFSQSGSNVTFTLDGNYLITGQGTVSNNTMTLLGSLPQLSNSFTMDLTFSADGQNFYGRWGMTQGDVGGTITGTKTPWPIYYGDINSPPQFVSQDVIELSKITQISKFRSGAGHDYSDDFETCRSMKHYFVPKPEADQYSVGIYSPIDGTVIATTEEYTDDSVYKGILVGIQSDEYPAFHFAIFHINTVSPLKVGDKVSAGQLLGTPPDYDNWTIADTAVGVNTPSGYRLISYFQVMDDSLFSSYQARGAGSRTDFIITKEDRDADPLICEGEEEFEDEGNLDNWFELN